MLPFSLSLSVRRVAVALAVAVVVVVANPSWATAVGIDVWNLPELQAQLEAGKAQERAFDDEEAELSHRIELKDRLIDDLIAGRTTLAEVTSQFLTLNKDRPGYMTVIRATYPGRNDEERMARNVIGFATPQLNQLSPTDLDLVMARLTTELSQFVASPAAAE